MFDYAEIANIATGLLKEFGQVATFVRFQTECDITIGECTDKPVAYSGFACLFGYAQAEIDETRILSGDAKVYLQKTEVEPKVGDGILINNITWRVVGVSVLSPANQSVLAVLQVRQSKFNDEVLEIIENFQCPAKITDTFGTPDLYTDTFEQYYFEIE